jgi:hypothetical protein
LPQANESDSLLNADIEVNYTSISSRTHSELYSNADLQVDKDKVDTGDIDERLFSWKKLWSYTGPGKCYYTFKHAPLRKSVRCRSLPSELYSNPSPSSLFFFRP